MEPLHNFHNSKMVMVLSTFPRPPKMELLLKKMTGMSSIVCLYSNVLKILLKLSQVHIHPQTGSDDEDEKAGDEGVSVDLEISSDKSGLVECCWMMTMRIITDDGSVITQLFIDV